MAPLIPPERRRARIAALGAILIAVVVVVVRGRGNGPIPLKAAVRAATNGSFYHWSAWSTGGTMSLKRAEGWCAQRRSRTLRFFGRSLTEERMSPSGIYRKDRDRASFESRTDVTGMEEGNDFLTKAAARLSGLDSNLLPMGGDRWQGGAASYTLEPRTARILRIDAPYEHIVIDYPLALSSDLFERPR